MTGDSGDVSLGLAQSSAVAQAQVRDGAGGMQSSPDPGRLPQLGGAVSGSAGGT